MARLQKTAGYPKTSEKNYLYEAGECANISTEIKENSSGQGDPDEAAKLSPREFPIGGTVRKPQG